MSTNQIETRTIPLADLVVSNTAAQKERRAHMDKQSLDELAASVRMHGVIQPILVRPQDKKFEIVVGERRYLAAKKADLSEIPATVRNLDDVSVHEIQLIENLQREGLHELAEAEGYEELMQLGNYTVDDVAAKVGKSKGTVYARLKLLALTPALRKAFYAGQVQASVALLLARIPNNLQAEALRDVSAVTTGPTYNQREALSYREAAEVVQRDYMLRLADAPFNAGDATLVPKAGACQNCPKNTLAQPDLFPDVKSGKEGVCTDTACFRSKCDAHDARRIAAAKEAGQKVVDGAEAKKIYPYGGRSDAQGGFTGLDEVIYAGGKSIKVSTLVKDVKPIIVKVTGDRDDDEPSGTTRTVLKEVVPERDVQAALKEKGIKTGAAASGGTRSSNESARRKKAKAETVVRFAVYKKIREELPSRLDRDDLNMFAVKLVTEVDSQTLKKLYELWTDWQEPVKAKGASWIDYHEIIEGKIQKLSDKELVRLMFDTLVIHELTAGAYDSREPERLKAWAKRFKVSESDVRKEVQSAQAMKVGKPNTTRGVKKAKRARISKKK